MDFPAPNGKHIAVPRLTDSCAAYASKSKSLLALVNAKMKSRQIHHKTAIERGIQVNTSTFRQFSLTSRSISNMAQQQTLRIKVASIELQAKRQRTSSMVTRTYQHNRAVASPAMRPNAASLHDYSAVRDLKSITLTRSQPKQNHSSTQTILHPYNIKAQCLPTRPLAAGSTSPPVLGNNRNSFDLR